MKEIYAEQKQIRRVATDKKKSITQQESAREQTLMSSSDVQAQTWSTLDIKENQNAIHHQLEKQTTLSKSEQSEILNLLRRHPPNNPKPSEERTVPKTDPAQETIKVLKTVPDDI